jgi:hypothetical protein
VARGDNPSGPWANDEKTISSKFLDIGKFIGHACPIETRTFLRRRNETRSPGYFFRSRFQCGNKLSQFFTQKKQNDKKKHRYHVFLPPQYSQEVA